MAWYYASTAVVRPFDPSTTVIICAWLPAHSSCSLAALSPYRHTCRLPGLAYPCRLSSRPAHLSSSYRGYLDDHDRTHVPCEERGSYQLAYTGRLVVRSISGVNAFPWSACQRATP